MAALNAQAKWECDQLEMQRAAVCLFHSVSLASSARPAESHCGGSPADVQCLESTPTAPAGKPQTQPHGTSGSKCSTYSKHNQRRSRARKAKAAEKAAAKAAGPAAFAAWAEQAAELRVQRAAAAAAAAELSRKLSQQRQLPCGARTMKDWLAIKALRALPTSQSRRRRQRRRERKLQVAAVLSEAAGAGRPSPGAGPSGAPQPEGAGGRSRDISDATQHAGRKVRLHTWVTVRR